MTWIDLLREKLPDSMFASDHKLRPAECPRGLLGGNAPGLDDDDLCAAKSCRKCWNSEVEE